MNPWSDLVPVQQLDTALLRLDHRSAQLPERAARDAVDEKLTALRAEIAAAEAEKHVLVRRQRAIEDEVASLRDKIAAEEAKLYGEGSTDPGHLQDLQAEIAALRGRVGALEDDELDLMEQVEPIDARIAEFTERRRALDEEATAANVALAEAESAIETERRAVTDERRDLAAAIDPDLLGRYDRARDQMGGVAVALLEAGSCGACHLKLSAVERDRIQHLPADAEVRCEECGRYLVRT